jgi:hypothetical protein
MGLFGITEERAHELLERYFGSAKVAVLKEFGTIREEVNRLGGMTKAYVTQVLAAEKRLDDKMKTVDDSISGLDARIAGATAQVVEDARKELLGRYALRPVEPQEIPFAELTARVQAAETERRYQDMIQHLMDGKISGFHDVSSGMSLERFSVFNYWRGMGNACYKIPLSEIYPFFTRNLSENLLSVKSAENVLYLDMYGILDCNGCEVRPDIANNFPGYVLRFKSGDSAYQSLLQNPAERTVLGAKMIAAWYMGVVKCMEQNPERPTVPAELSTEQVHTTATVLTKLLNAPNMQNQRETLEAFGREFIQNYPAAAVYINLQPK